MKVQHPPSKSLGCRFSIMLFWGLAGVFAGCNQLVPIVGLEGSNLSLSASSVADGRLPTGDLILSDNTLYGMTAQGGSANKGSILSVRIDGTGQRVLHSFSGGVSDGDSPWGSLILSGNTLYGMTTYGGVINEGTIFSIGTDGTDFRLLHFFMSGYHDTEGPMGSLILSGTNLYGMAGAHQSSLLNSAIFSIGIDGTDFKILHFFTGGDPAWGGHAIDGDEPWGSLIRSESTLYGMTLKGGTANKGTIFSIGMDGTGYKLLHSFSFAVSEGRSPYGSLVHSGNALYGMTSRGGTADKGTIFSIGMDGTGFTLLHSFTGGAADGEFPEGSLVFSGNRLYGMTYIGGSSTRIGNGAGTIFSIGMDGTGFTLLRSFGGGASDGLFPVGSLILSGSTLYGMTANGGLTHGQPLSDGRGTVFGIETSGTGFSNLHQF